MSIYACDIQKRRKHEQEYHGRFGLLVILWFGLLSCVTP